MDREEKLRRLAARMDVTEEAARAALEVCGWDLLDAALLLDRDRPEEGRRTGYYSTAVQTVPSPAAGDSSAHLSPAAPEPPPSGAAAGERIWGFFQGILTHPADNRLLVTRDGAEVVSVPALALAALVLVSFWTTVGLTVLGCGVGCRFTLLGPQWDIPGWNAALDRLWRRTEELRRRGGQWLKSGRRR